MWYKSVTWLEIHFSFHFNSLFGHLVPYKHQRQVPNILEIIHVATLVRAHTNAHAHTHTRKYTHTYTRMTVSAMVAGINITQYTWNKVCYYDVHTLYIIHSISSRVDSDISQYCSRMLSNECSKWPAPCFSESTFTLDLECIAIYLILIPIGVFSKLAFDTNNWIMELLLSSHDS